MWLPGCSSRSPFSVYLRPTDPLDVGACVAEARSLGGGTLGWSDLQTLCATGLSKPLYHAILANSGERAFAVCRARAYDARGKKVFEGLLVLPGPFPAGLFAEAHTTIEFDWYLPTRPSSTIERYEASCSVNEHPPI